MDTTIGPLDDDMSFKFIFGVIDIFIPIRYEEFSLKKGSDCYVVYSAIGTSRTFDSHS